MRIQLNIIIGLLSYTASFCHNASGNDDTTYQQAYNCIISQSGTIESAIYYMENAWHDGMLSKEEYTQTIAFHTERIRQLAVANAHRLPELNMVNPFAAKDSLEKEREKVLLNWAIYTYITDTTRWYENGQYTVHYPMVYDTTDPYGIKNHENTLITTLLNSEKRKGNCYSMAVLFKIFSDRLQTDAILVSAPNHIFIQHKGFDGNYYNVELATRFFPGSGTIKTLTQSTHSGVVSGISLHRLDAVSEKALALVYLAKGYEKKAAHADPTFLLTCAETALQYDDNCLQAYLLKVQVLERLVANGSKDKEEILVKELLLLDKMGYRDPSLSGTGYSHLSPFPFLHDYETYFTLSEGQYRELEEESVAGIHISCSDLDPSTGALAVHYNADIDRLSIDPVLLALSIDPLAEKFPSQAPYVGMDDNPVNKIDPDGNKPIDVSAYIYEGNNRPNLVKIVNDLEVITGLDIHIKKVSTASLMTYSPPAGNQVVVPQERWVLTYTAPTGNESGSETARNLFMDIVDSEQEISLHSPQTLVNVDQVGSKKYGSHTTANEDENSFFLESPYVRPAIYLDGSQIEEFISGTSDDLDPRTFGWGMVLLHELGHKYLGLNDPRFDITKRLFPGENVRLMNKIRRELGHRWGERQRYRGIKIKGDPHIYHPFTKEALEQLEQETVPQEGVVTY